MNWDAIAFFVGLGLAMVCGVLWIIGKILTAREKQRARIERKNQKDKLFHLVRELISSAQAFNISATHKVLLKMKESPVFNDCYKHYGPNVAVRAAMEQFPEDESVKAYADLNGFEGEPTLFIKLLSSGHMDRLLFMIFATEIVDSLKDELFKAVYND